MQAADPRDGALDAQAEAAVRHATVTAQVEVPLERLARQAVLVDALFERGEIVDTLAAADDLAVAFRREQIGTEHDLGALGVRLHVERLRDRRVAVDEYRLLELRGEHRLVAA